MDRYIDSYMDRYMDTLEIDWVSAVEREWSQVDTIESSARKLGNLLSHKCNKYGKLNFGDSDGISCSAAVLC